MNPPPVQFRSSRLAQRTLTLAIAGAGCFAMTPVPAHDHGALTSGARAGFEREMNAGMARMMEDMHSAGYSGNVDADFLAMMIPHHAGAIDMARLELQHGRDPVTRQLAEEVIATQTVEIESMRRRLKTLRQPAPGGHPEFPALGGTRGP